LTTIIDLAGREIVGWSLSENMTAENTVMKALVKAIRNRKLLMGLFFILIELFNTLQKRCVAFYL